MYIAHRAHASTEGVTAFLKPSVAGFLLQKELDYLQCAVDVPKRPFAAIVGGSKVSSKISVIEVPPFYHSTTTIHYQLYSYHNSYYPLIYIYAQAMLSKVDKLVLGGGMVFTFLKARGYNVGKSLVEDDQLELAKKLEKIAIEKGVKLYLASDVVLADKFAADAFTQVVNIDAIPDGWMGLGMYVCMYVCMYIHMCDTMMYACMYRYRPQDHRRAASGPCRLQDCHLERAYGCLRVRRLRQGHQCDRNHPR